MSSSKKKPKFYVVWRGNEPGIYTTWEACEAQTKGFRGASYKSFPTKEEAEAAFKEGAPVRQVAAAKVSQRRTTSFPENPPSYRHDTVLPLPPEVTANAWVVDAACSGNPGKMEYRGVDLATGAEMFNFGPLLGTNNIGEFLAIVHAVALLQKQGLSKTIYSDSRIALSWVRQKRCKTTLTRNASTERLFQIIARAEAWLAANPITVPICKWNTEQWGEIPADYGRKQ